MTTTPTARQFAVLREVALLQTPDWSPRVATIAERCRLTDAQVRNIARRLSSPHWDTWRPVDGAEPRGHPWLEYRRHTDTVRATEDGKRALGHARGNPHLPGRVTEWKDEALTGMRADGDPSNIDRAVLSSMGLTRGGGRDPECAALTELLVQSYGVPPSEVPALVKRQMLFCARCHRLGRMPFKKPAEFRRLKGGARRFECKTCEAEERAERRQTQ